MSNNTVAQYMKHTEKLTMQDSALFIISPLAFTWYEEVQKVVAVVRVGHTPNAKAVIRAISTQTFTLQRLLAYAKSCVQGALEHCKHQLESSLKVPLSAFKAVQNLLSDYIEASIMLRFNHKWQDLAIKLNNF